MDSENRVSSAWVVSALVGWAMAALMAGLGGYFKAAAADLRESMDLCKAGNYRLSEEISRAHWALDSYAATEKAAQEVTRQAP